MKQRAVTLHSLLTRLIWLCVLPLVLLAVYLTGVHVHTIQTQQDSEASDHAYNLAAAIDNDLSSRINALQALADSPLMDKPTRLKEFYNEAQGFRKSFCGHVILADTSMQMIFNTRVPFGSVLPKLPKPKGHAAAPVVLSTGKPAVGDMFFGPIAKEPLIAIVVPVIRNGKTKALLLSIIETGQFQKRIDKLSLPVGWSLTLLDGKYEVMAQRLGKNSESSRTDERNSKRFTAKLTVSNWSVLLEIPPGIYRVPIIFTTVALIAAIILITFISILAGRLTGRRLAGSMATLTKTPLTEPLYPRIAEIEEIRTALNNAAETRDASERALRESEDKFRHIFESANVGKSITLPTGEINVNKAFADMLGYTQKELKYKKWQDLTPQEEIETVQKILTPLFSGKKNSARFEKRYIHKNGEHVWADVSVAIRCDQDNKPLYFITTIIDITERKKGEKALHRSEEWFRSLFENMQEGYAHCRIIFDEEDRPVDFVYLNVNNSFERLTGLKDVVGKKETEIFPGVKELHPEMFETFGRVALTGKPEKYEIDFKPLKQVFILSIYSIEKGYCVLTFDNITERKKADEELTKHREHLEKLVRERTIELKDSQTALMNIVDDLTKKSEELRVANERLKELDRLKSMFIASMSHELRTPLNSIIGFSSIILNEWLGPLNNKQRENLSSVLRSGKHLLSLINDVIDVSKIEAGMIEVNIDDFDLDSVIQEAVDSFKNEIKDKKLKLKVESIHQKMHTDRRRLLQIVMNLMSNAVKFTERGSVKIEVKKIRRSEVKKEISTSKNLNFSTSYDFIEITVEDTGIGIKESEIPRLFNAFVRLESPLKAMVLGTGLGLYLTKKLVQDILKGEIMVVSKEGKGSRFTLRMPASIRQQEDRKLGS